MTNTEETTIIAPPQEEKVLCLLDKSAIEALIPHRNTMLLLDGAAVMEASKDWIFKLGEKKFLDKFVEGQYFVSPDSVFVDGHFPGFKIFPGFLIAEAMAQTAALNFAYFNKDLVGKKFVLAEAKDLFWKRPVFPGNRLFTIAFSGEQRTVHDHLFIDFYTSTEVDRGDGKRKIAAHGTITGCIL